MEFNQEMPTTPFISLIYRNHAKYLNKKVCDVNLTYGLYPFLIEIYNHDGISQEDLAKVLYLNESTVTRNLNKLEKKGFVKKTPEKRKKIITLTDEGAEIAKKELQEVDFYDYVVVNDDLDKATQEVKDIIVNKI